MIKKIISLLSFSLFFVACDPSTSTEQAIMGCSSTVAHIQVYDGTIVRTCGCTETSNVAFNSGQTLTCTISLGATIYFDYVNISVSHQMTVISNAATPIVNPDARQPVQTFPITPSAQGTFQFYDIFFPTIGGSIVVN